MLIGAAAAATGAVNFDTDLMSQEWRNLDPPDAAILSIALFLAWLFGGYVAGRMARRAGLSHGFYTWALGAVLLVGAVAGLDEMSAGRRVAPPSFRALGIPTAFDDWRDLPGPGRAGVGADRARRRVRRRGAWVSAGTPSWSQRAADPTIGPDAPARVGGRRAPAAATTGWSTSASGSGTAPRAGSCKPTDERRPRREQTRPQPRHARGSTPSTNGVDPRRWTCVLSATRSTGGSASSRWTGPTA